MSMLPPEKIRSLRPWQESPVLLFASLISALPLPFVSQFAEIFGFVRLPLNFYLILGLTLLAYFNLVEKMKCWFYARFSR